MKAQLFQTKLIIKKSTLHGYGVFSGKKIKKGELIEECYILITKGDDKNLEDFYFDGKNRRYVILTGFGSIYNHADEPNATYNINIKNRLARIKAIKTIRKGEEIFISYGEKWFSTRGVRAKNIKLFLSEKL